MIWLTGVDYLRFGFQMMTYTNICRGKESIQGQKIVQYMTQIFLKSTFMTYFLEVSCRHFIALISAFRIMYEILHIWNVADSL